MIQGTAGSAVAGCHLGSLAELGAAPPARAADRGPVTVTGTVDSGSNVTVTPGSESESTRAGPGPPGPIMASES
jgi:hypothetical protein